MVTQSGQVPRPTPATSASGIPGCLSENDVVDFFAGYLGEDAAAALERHVESCRSCWELLAFVALP